MTTVSSQRRCQRRCRFRRRRRPWRSSFEKSTLPIWNRNCDLWLQNLIFPPGAQRANSLRSAFAFLRRDHPPRKLKFQILICSCSQQTLSWLNRRNHRTTFNRFTTNRLFGALRKLQKNAIELKQTERRKMDTEIWILPKWGRARASWLRLKSHVIKCFVQSLWAFW